MIVVDSNLVIASVMIGHQFSEALRSGELVMRQHVVIESFSVLTRAPERQFVRERDIQTSGGAVYDALIAVAAIPA
jgi:hypothetical protein